MTLTLGGVSVTIRSGAWIPVLLLVPNIIWMLSPKPETAGRAAEPRVLTVIENIGRISAVLILPWFYSLDLQRPYSLPAAIVMGLALAVYYLAWGRYFAGGRTADLMRAPLLGIPLPLAVAPVAFLFMSAYLMGSWWMLAASALFGIAHIWISIITL
jgi:hypothetical protein